MYYIGANSFGQIPDCHLLSCKEPLLITNDVSLLNCGFGSIVWLNNHKDRLNFSGHKDSEQTHKVIEVPVQNYNSLFRGLGGEIYIASDSSISEIKWNNDSPDIETRPVFSRFTEALKASSQSIKEIKCSGKEVFCLTSKGQLWNLDGDSGKLINVPGFITSFACGEEHCVAVTKEQEVFSWGSSLKGQLGIGTLKEEKTPQRISALGGLAVIQIACGKWHNVALTAEGDLYVWGWNKYGQLGLPCPDFENLDSIGDSTTVLAEPTLLDFQIGVRKVACGSSHTVVLADDGELWGCGFSKFGQLGKDGVDKNDKLTHLNLSLGKIENVLAAFWSTVILSDLIISK